MTKSRFKIIYAVIVTALVSMMLFTNVYGIEPRTVEPRDQASEGEAVPTSDDGIMPISEEGTTPISDDGHNHTAIDEINIHEGDLYILYGEDFSTTNYVMDKYVDGNVFIFGQNVTITGQINGSLFVFANNLTIEEQAGIGLHTFAFADTITVKGITSDMYAFANKFNLTDTGMIYRDLKLAANECYLTGTVVRDVHLATDKAEVYQGEQKKLKVGGDFNYTSKTEIENLDKASIEGERKFTLSKDIEPTSRSLVLNFVYRAIENIIFALVIYSCLIFLTPKFIEKSKDYVSVKGLLTLPIGLGFTILVPIIALILMITGIGVSLSFVLLMIYFLVLMINSSIVTVVINEFISDKLKISDSTWKKILMIIPVALVVFLIRQIPVLGGWITALILFAGTGLVVLYQFNKRKKETKAEDSVIS